MSKINYGPAHPAVHGALRLILDVDGEKINDITPDIGYMHRGIEKILESKKYAEAIPYFDRIDYVSAVTQEYSYVLAVEKLLDLNVPIRAQYIRVLMAELTRIANHLIHINMLTYDSGAISPFVWAMEEREKIMWIFAEIAGARLHLNYFRIGGVAADISNETIAKIELWIEHFKGVLNDIEDVITNSYIFKKRTRGIGVISKELALEHGVTGSTLRSTGIEWDLRKKAPYDVYDKLEFNIPIGTNGDCYDRYLVKTAEIKESLSIIKQCIEQLPDGDIIANDKRYCPPKDMKHGDIVYHIKHYVSGFKVKPGSIYMATEAPKGEFGVMLVSDGSTTPYRCHMRSAGFPILGLLKHIAHTIADLPVILASLDIVLGEVDR